MLSRLASRIQQLSSTALMVAALVGAILVIAGGFAAYRTYDYVQHDNDFCMSCHLMAEPFEQFAESAHRGLGCKACHQPTLIERSQMALTQIIENPEELAVHAEVPNETCSQCHIEGDPERWRVIANTVGHRVHLESDDPALAGLECVECHATSLHEFAPIDRTCAQSSCHEDNTIRLGSMSELTIHCAACHTFVAPVAAPSDPATPLSSADENRAILPHEDECLSCHVMRTLVDLPEPDPHEGDCASCHNPHVQATPEEAVASCGAAGCHTDTAITPPMHLGLAADELEDCSSCHTAHDFAVGAEGCTTCHQPVVDPATASFRHDQHRDVDCASCHAGPETHGGVTVATTDDCRSCHHEAPTPASVCTQCHTGADTPVERVLARRAVDFSVGEATTRDFAFEHGWHEEVGCATCHTDGLELSAAASDCTSCHVEHHAPEVDCAACHSRPPIEAHPPDEAHVTCSGAACHQAVPFESVPRTRQVCEGCHQDLRDHRPGQPCSECHALPNPRGGIL